MLRGSGLPAAMVVQRPRAAGRAQLRQGPVQALSQQTPSMHWLERHSLARVQVWPGNFGPQVLFTQAMPLSQSAFVVQVFVHAPLTQRKGWQLCTPGSRQVPRPSQVPAVFS